MITAQEKKIRRRARNSTAVIARRPRGAKDIFLVGNGLIDSPIKDRSETLAKLLAEKGCVVHVHVVAFPPDVVDAIAALSSGQTLRIVCLMRADQASPICREIEARRAAGDQRWLEPLDLLRGLTMGKRLEFLERAIALARARP